MIDYEDYEKEARKREEDFDSISNYLEKQKRIKKEITRLKRLFSKIDENKKKLVFTTIEDVAFMTVTMQDLREEIVREGATCEYKNGANQYGTKQSPQVQIYLQMSQKQTQAMKILVDCLPKTEKPLPKNDGFEDFINGRDD